jgi:hypothetical protein
LGSVASARAISSRLRPGVPRPCRRIRELARADALQHGAGTGLGFSAMQCAARRSSFSSTDMPSNVCGT